nr:hypothetical protein NCPCFENI_00942 [Cupriavidus sp.]
MMGLGPDLGKGLKDFGQGLCRPNGQLTAQTTLGITSTNTTQLGHCGEVDDNAMRLQQLGYPKARIGSAGCEQRLRKLGTQGKQTLQIGGPMVAVWRADTVPHTGERRPRRIRHC